MSADPFSFGPDEKERIGNLHFGTRSPGMGVTLEIRPINRVIYNTLIRILSGTERKNLIFVPERSAMEMKKSVKIAFAAGTLLLFAAYFCGITFFPHTHEINGVRITHSHPYSGSQDQPDHNHTTIEFEAIAHLSLWASVLLAVVRIVPALIVRSYRYAGFVPGGTGRESLSFPQLRGPPVR